MEATTSVITQQACVDASGVNLAGMRSWSVKVDLVLTVKYTNIGRCPIILDKSSGAVGGENISGSEQDAQSKNYVYRSFINTMVVSEKARIEDGNRPGDSFVILKPGETHEGKSKSRLLINQNYQYNLLSSNPQFLMLGVWTTDGKLDDANGIDELRTKWKKYGYLWTEGITTRPMSISFPKLEELKPCK